MARKPNYRFERAERERRKAERRAKREQRKADARLGTDSLSTEPGPAPEQSET